MKHLKEVENERAQFEKDGHNLDIFLCSQIEECTEAALEKIRQGTKRFKRTMKKSTAGYLLKW